MERLNLLKSHLTTSSTSIIEVHDTKDFLSTLKTHSQESTVIIFTAGDIGNGKTWCSDCDRAKQNIEEYVINQVPKGEKVIKCVIKQAEYTPQHPYKQSKLIKLKGIPTVVLVRNGEVVLRAEKDEDFTNVGLLSMIAQHD
ncbi:hypothetical protein FGO68_gene3717 [Halteria grandinella]|uniref:Thioredoxin domain-containing protein n=1 Tax=Halteria grandinella TaxID=5974 RepID=A0A8J8T3E7_HALGN|nr:hypothetical protein FGO68_gene3717 [Halteria grandinella]